MRAGWLVLVAVGSACSSASAVLDDYGASSGESVAPDAALAPDASGTEDAPCSDCEYFPETCSATAFCPNGPFAPNTLGGSFNVRTAITAIRGRSTTDIWAAGAIGAIAHYDGTSWTRSDSGTQETMRALWLRDATEVAVGSKLGHIFARGGEIQDGGAMPSDGGWSAYALPPSDGRLFSTAWAASAADSLWCASTDNSIWRLRQLPSLQFEFASVVPAFACQAAYATCAVYGMHGPSENELWAVGAQGVTVRIAVEDGGTPSVKSFNSQTWNGLNGVWAASSSDVWAVGARGTIRRYTGDPMFWDIVSDVPTSVDLNAVWGFSSSDIWAVGGAGVVLHYDGTSWSRVKIAGIGVDRPNLLTVWGAEAGHVWIGGQGVVLSLGGKP